jgi:hypothetical protein
MLGALVTHSKSHIVGGITLSMIHFLLNLEKIATDTGSMAKCGCTVGLLETASCGFVYATDCATRLRDRIFSNNESYRCELSGVFAVFSMLRRYAEKTGYYISSTIWKDQKVLDNWRASDKFKISHANHRVTKGFK